MGIKPCSSLVFSKKNENSFFRKTYFENIFTALKTAVELEWKNYIVDMYSNMALGKLCDDFKSSNIIWALWPQPASIYLLKTLGFNEDEYIFG